MVCVCVGSQVSETQKENSISGSSEGLDVTARSSAWRMASARVLSWLLPKYLASRI
jgi:hypothetical protein